MLFMGEEWDARQPFMFFCDFEPELAAAVREGRRQEFARFPEFRDAVSRERIPDPTAAETFRASKLAWADLERTPHADRIDWYRRILAVRRREIVPLLEHIPKGGSYRVLGDRAVLVHWEAAQTADLMLAANLSPTPLAGFPPVAGRVIWQEGTLSEGGCLGPWAVRWSISANGEGQPGGRG
jgi:1,4-alpha-glucan branching enzyme